MLPFFPVKWCREKEEWCYLRFCEVNKGDINFIPVKCVEVCEATRCSLSSFSGRHWSGFRTFALAKWDGWGWGAVLSLFLPSGWRSA